MQQSVSAVSADPHVFLIGRPPLGEYLGFLTSQTVEGETSDPGSLTGAWRVANDHIRELEQTEQGWADSPAVQPLPDALNSARDRVLADPMVQHSFAIVPISIGVVDLDRLVVFQKHVNLAYVRELREQLGQRPGDEAVFHFCVPIDSRSDPPIHAARFAQNGWTFISPSTDLRMLEAAVIEPSQVARLDVGGVPKAILAVVVGYGSNFLSAIRAEGRLILNNGSHRAYALREAGFTHVPCLIQDVSRREELEVMANRELAQNPDLYLTAARPPVMKDYFDEALRMIVHVPRKVRHVQVAFNAEPRDLPAG
jgi:hypothetical protein